MCAEGPRNSSSNALGLDMPTYHPFFYPAGAGAQTVVEVMTLDNYAGPEGEDFFARATPEAVGIDLYAAENVSLMPGERKVIPVGFKIALPAWMEGQVRPKSGRAAKEGLTVLNTPGTIDPDFRGEVGVIAYNSNPVITADDLLAVDKQGVPVYFAQFLWERARMRKIVIERGQKIAQLVFAYYETPEIVRVTALDDTERGEGGFGSTGL